MKISVLTAIARLFLISFLVKNEKFGAGGLPFASLIPVAEREITFRFLLVLLTDHCCLFLHRNRWRADRSVKRSLCFPEIKKELADNSQLLFLCERINIRSQDSPHNHSTAHPPFYRFRSSRIHWCMYADAWHHPASQ